MLYLEPYIYNQLKITLFMKIQVNDKNWNQMIKKFQEGGEMTPPADAAPAETAPAEAAPEGGDPTAQILEAAMAALQNQDCNLAMQVLQAIVQMLGGGAPEGPAAPEGQAPVFKKGGKLAGWIQK